MVAIRKIDTILLLASICCLLFLEAAEGTRLACALALEGFDVVFGAAVLEVPCVLPGLLIACISGCDEEGAAEEALFAEAEA